MTKITLAEAQALWLSGELFQGPDGRYRLEDAQGSTPVECSDGELHPDPDVFHAEAFKEQG